MLNEENWKFCYYLRGVHRIFISYGGEPNPDNYENMVDLYYATIVDKNERQAFQKTFTAFEDAADYINNNYSHWDFVNETIPN